MDRIALLNQLFDQGTIRLQPASFLHSTPPPLPDDFDFERVEGMLLGLAVGDALGATSESMTPSARMSGYGEIRDYLPNLYAGGRRVGVADDDSQMAFWTLEQLLEAGQIVPDDLARKFTQHRIYGIGTSVSQFVHAYRYQGLPWYKAAQHSAGNGALMRIAPVVIPHLRQPSPALWADAALAGMVTHNDRASSASCLAFVNILWECLRMSQPPEPAWWVDTFVEVASQLEGDSHYETRTRAVPYQGPLWRFVDQELHRALAENWPVLEACNRWYSAAYLMETVPCVLYILARHSANPEEAIVRSVNDTWDNDTVAAIVGAAVGALHGRKGLPRRWVANWLGRTTADNDWHAFELIEAARQRFWQADPPLTLDNIQAVLKFLPLLEQPDFTPGAWETPAGTLGYFTYAPVVLDFIRALGSNGFLQPFDWQNWAEGQQLLDRPELLEKASLPTLRKLLTLHVRADRFIEGHLAEAFTSGQIVRILKRLEQIWSASRAA